MTTQQSADERSVDIELWRPYRPTDEAPWDLRRVVHLHRRAGFAATWNELQRDLHDGPDESIGRVLSGTARDEFQLVDFESILAIIGRSAARSNHPDRLKAWWLFRMLFTPDPLAEKLALMWHNHFATSNLKVNDLALMRQQNETLRKHALGRFSTLLNEMAHDPALLVWLDAPSNRAGKPNENLSRETMELFALGLGNYTEGDVKQAARALTGWTLREGRFYNLTEMHDVGSKTILGRTGNWTGDDFVEILLKQPAVAHRLAWRLTNEFFGENVVDDSALEQLAQGLAEHHLDIGWGVETILRSELFFSEANLGSRVCDPVSFLLIPLRAIEHWREPPSTVILAEWSDRMGQQLFYPPNVGGWTGGRSWLSTRAVIARANYAEALADGQLAIPPRPPQLIDVMAPQSQSFDVAPMVRALCELLFGQQIEPALGQIMESVAAEPDRNVALRRSLAELLKLPEAQLN